MEYDANGYKVTMIFPKKYPDGTSILASVWNAMTTELRELEVISRKFPFEVSGEARRTIKAFCTLLQFRRLNEFGNYRPLSNVGVARLNSRQCTLTITQSTLNL
jgi:hypothetical protein